MNIEASAMLKHDDAQLKNNAITQWCCQLLLRLGGLKPIKQNLNQE